MGTTETLARFVVETPGEAIPPEAIRWAKVGMLDCLGTALAGSRRPLGKIIRELVKELGGNPNAVVVGGGFRTSATNAALANGTMAHALDFDDGGGGWGHASVALFPAIVSLGDERKVSGRQAIEAYVMGYELAGSLAKNSPRDRDTQINGFHSTALYGTMASAAAMARLLKLDVEQTRLCLGIAGSWAGGLLKNIGSMTKPLHAGKACMAGVLAALLAQRGFTADRDIIEAPDGFAFAFWHGKGSLDSVTRDLGKQWVILQSPLGIKPYPSCRHNHSALDSLLGLIKENGVAYDQIQAVQLDLPTVPPFFYRDAEEEEQGKFSFEHNLAVAIREGKPTIESFDDDVVRSPRIKEAAAKVRIVEHRDWGHAEEVKGDMVTLKLKDGRTFSRRTAVKKGDPGDPFTQQELGDKFLANASYVLAKDKARQALDLMENLEQVRSLAQVADIVVGP